MWQKLLQWSFIQPLPLAVVMGCLDKCNELRENWSPVLMNAKWGYTDAQSWVKNWLLRWCFSQNVDTFKYVDIVGCQYDVYMNSRFKMRLNKNKTQFKWYGYHTCKFYTACLPVWYLKCSSGVFRITPLIQDLFFIFSGGFRVCWQIVGMGCTWHKERSGTFWRCFMPG